MDKLRSNFTEIPFVTIDSESTLDIDDAIHVSKLDTGYRILIAIANPAKAVMIDSSEDRQARLIAATAYIRDKAVRRMLPVHISEDHSSLLANKLRNALIYEITLSSDLESSSIEIFSTKIQVQTRISYEQIPAILNDVTHPAKEMLAIAANLSKALLQSRRNHGAMAMFDMSRLILTDEEGNIRQLRTAEETIGNIIVQEMMILSNTLVARYMLEHNIPAIYRNHKPRLSAPTADKMAETLEGWINSKNYDEETIKQQFAAIASKANYGASVTGHYGLNLPYYLHITSPLRRYADLVNIRQVLAFLSKEELPYTVESLQVLADNLNEAIERRKQERSDGFKVVVTKTAHRAIERGDLYRLADHELSQAVKLSAQAGEMPDILAEELSRRMSVDILSDKIADVLMIDLSGIELPEQVSNDFGKWLSEHPTKALHMLMHASNVQFITELNIVATGEATSFTATASLKDNEGKYYEAKGSGSRKKDAEQLAAVRLVGMLMGIVVKPLNQSEKSKNTHTDQNYKGVLLEMCQKYKWPMPIFKSSGKGPSHAMTFDATVEVRCGNAVYVAHSNNVASKKDAESKAAQNLLKDLKDAGVASAKLAKPNQSGTDNPVGFIQEVAQKNHYALPEYIFNQITEVPPLFECSLKLNFGIKEIFKGHAENKQSAKKLAASSAVSASKDSWAK